jgi:hypothetical protein
MEKATLGYGTQCAKQNETCNFTGNKFVAYVDSNGSIIKMDNMNGSIQCNDSTFKLSTPSAGATTCHYADIPQDVTNLSSYNKDGSPFGSTWLKCTDATTNSTACKIPAEPDKTIDVLYGNKHGTVTPQYYNISGMAIDQSFDCSSNYLGGINDKSHKDCYWRVSDYPQTPIPLGLTLEMEFLFFILPLTFSIIVLGLIIYGIYKMAT